MIVVPASVRSATTVYLRAVCVSGTFTLRSKGQFIFGGDCDPHGLIAEDIPRSHLDLDNLHWEVTPGSSWTISVWAR